MPATHASSGAEQPRRTAAAQLRFNFDNGESLRPGTRVRNVAGRGGGGVVLVAGGGRLRPVKGVSGRAARFPRICCGRALIEVADRPSLDPGRRAFTFGATAKVGPRQISLHSNVVQKGYYTQPGGQYKLQLDAGRPSCVVYGSEGRVIARSARRIPARQWLRLTCRRVATRVTLRVNGQVWASARGSTGRLANASVLRVGAKKLRGRRVDQYHGRLDDVFVRIAR